MREGYPQEGRPSIPRIVNYCAGGGRSVLASDVLREMGFPDVANFETGVNSWKAAGLPVEGAPPDVPREAGPAWTAPR
jgi:rhodanese-related sulfurtransferase